MLDIDAAIVAALKEGVVPIYEQGLTAMVKRNISELRLSFTSSLAEAIADAEVLFIGVGTPSKPDGSANLDYVLAVAQEIGRSLDHYLVIVDKSTVPVGTAQLVTDAIEAELQLRGVDIPFDVVSNPEFLKEGAAVEDFMNPDRVIIGSDSHQAVEIMRHLYAPYVEPGGRLLSMGTKEAEMTKYAANAMLATKISFMNEIASICDRMDIDVEMVRKGIGSDKRIGFSFINPGCGYGGSCFPKDVKALVSMANLSGIKPHVLDAVELRNQQQKRYLFDKTEALFDGDLKGRTVAIWGLAFKPETDDMREASSVALIEKLISAGCQIRAYDPVAMDEAARILPTEWFSSVSLP